MSDVPTVTQMNVSSVSVIDQGIGATLLGFYVLFSLLQHPTIK